MWLKKRCGVGALLQWRSLRKSLKFMLLLMLLSLFFVGISTPASWKRLDPSSSGHVRAVRNADQLHRDGELWTQFSRDPNLKDGETTTRFRGTCPACCGDYFGGGGRWWYSVRRKKNMRSRSGPTSRFEGQRSKRGSRPPGACNTDQRPPRISAYYISWSGKHANNKCMSNVLVFLLD